MSTPPVPRGPVRGAPPSLEWIAVDRLEVDQAYQRATDGPQSLKIIYGMVKAWDWSLCQPLVVARRADGSLWILDGQHRHQGAVMRGDIPHLPCVVLAGIGHTDEARTFVALNTQRQRLSQLDIFNGMLAAGDGHAKAVQELLEQTGWKQVRSRNTAARKPGELDCAPMLARTVAAGNIDAVRFALTVLIAAYPDRPVQAGATMLAAMFTVFHDTESTNITAARLIETLAASDPNEWIMRGAILRERLPTLSRHAALARAITAAASQTPRPSLPIAASADDDEAESMWGDLVDGDEDEGVVPDTPPAYRPAPRPAPAPAALATCKPALNVAAFGRSGKGFCTQCDQLVSQDRAAACRDRHCKMQVPA